MSLGKRRDPVGRREEAVAGRWEEEPAQEKRKKPEKARPALH